MVAHFDAPTRTYQEAQRPTPSPTLRFNNSKLGIVSLAARAGPWQPCGMTISSNPDRGFRFPREVIEHAVWLYHCFSLSLRDVELILAARGIVVSYESIRAIARLELTTAVLGIRQQAGCAMRL